MNKKIKKECIGALLASIILTTLPVTLSSAQTTIIPKIQISDWNEDSFPKNSEEPVRNVSHLTNNYNQLNETILLKVKELTEQGIKFNLIQTEIQNMLKNINTDFQKGKQNSISQRGFYGINIFSCRGFT